MRDYGGHVVAVILWDARVPKLSPVIASERQIPERNQFANSRTIMLTKDRVRLSISASTSKNHPIMPTSWKIAGSYFETCNCELACPCIFTSPPTSGECSVLIAWHIDQGRFGEVDLDGLNAVLAVHSPGHMLEGKWKVALYVDERANQDQQNALTQIFSGQAGGHLAGLAPLIGEILGAKAAPIEYHSEGKRRSLRLGNIANVEIEGLPGQDGMDVTITGPPFTVVPGFPAVVAKSKQARFSDYGLSWEVSNKNGFFSQFAYQST
jgi:hypothetical protein